MKLNPVELECCSCDYYNSEAGRLKIGPDKHMKIQKKKRFVLCVWGGGGSRGRECEICKKVFSLFDSSFCQHF